MCQVDKGWSYDTFICHLDITESPGKRVSMQGWPVGVSVGNCLYGLHLCKDPAERNMVPFPEFGSWLVPE